jgi:ADP-ribosylglycohydrolase
MTTEPYTLCWPSPGQTIGDDSLLERAQGCLLGQLAGDALGSMVEFQSASAIRAHYPQGLREIGSSPIFHTLAGQPTDDSELALVLARTLLRDQAFADDNVAAAYGYWRQSDPFDIGGTIGKATEAILDAQARGQDPAQAARREANSASEANGALMRQSPLAIWGYALDAGALDACVRADTTLTHPNRVCQDASAAFIVALAAVIREGLDAQAAYARACAWDQQHGASPTVRRALAAARHAPPAYEHNQGHVLIALQNAFYQALHAATLEDGVVATVMGGGDTDTNAAIAGALLGALQGARAVPTQWQRMVLTCRPRQGAPGVQQPRPPVFWPIDALQVAEQLLVAGVRYAQTHATPVRSGGAPDPRDTTSTAESAATIASSGHPAQPTGPTARRAHRPVPPAETRFISALYRLAMGSDSN